MVAIVYILNLLSPITIIAGLLGFIALLGGELDEWLWIVSGICGVGGLFFGLQAWSYGVPPRWFWSKSQVDLFGSKVGCVVDNMIQFFLIPLAIAFIVEVFD